MAGITSHSTIGGHYPSLCHDELLQNFPEIDSVVRYEGEETLIELVDKLRAGQDWRDIDGIAYMRDAEVMATQARALVPDLDALPFPYRPFKPRTYRWFSDTAVACKSRLYPALLLLLDPHFLPHRTRQGRAGAQARESAVPV
ncbi:hypothetical protein GCM10007874_33470 [Labrys miyagiensis]|uniref:B12-binding domain-containing protein n=2 Tax=Labrys miyagiensis TaxID=346912 RepID=A0ABQ6CJI9_9HYPH|nr:hypothetical protein GCM10007874_33470 [Labrys miyagiensis]